MPYAPHTAEALVLAAALVNASPSQQQDVELRDLDAVLTAHPIAGSRCSDPRELIALQSLREQLRRLWDAETTEAVVQVVNALLIECRARPHLARHDDLDWHLHAASDDQSLDQRIGIEVAMACVDLIHNGDLSRLRFCSGPTCNAVLVDLSRNHSRRFCDAGNCGNRLNVATYRRRRRHANLSPQGSPRHLVIDNMYC